MQTTHALFLGKDRKNLLQLSLFSRAVDTESRSRSKQRTKKKDVEVVRTVHWSLSKEKKRTGREWRRREGGKAEDQPDIDVL